MYDEGKPYEKCAVYDKKKKDGFPIRLYHGTSDLPSVCKNGLKLAEELTCDKKGRCGLGGANDGLISFTTDKEMAMVVAEEIKNLIDIANGEMDWEDLRLLTQSNELYYDKTTDFYKDEFESGTRQSNGRWLFDKIVDNLRFSNERQTFPPHNIPADPIAFDLYKEGYENAGFSIGDNNIQDIIDEWKEKRGVSETECIPVRIENDKLPEKFKQSYVMCPNPEKLKQDMFDLYKYTYLRQRQSFGGKPNPLFFGRPMENFIGMNGFKVGVVAVEGSIPIPKEKVELIKGMVKTAKRRYDIPIKEQELIARYSDKASDGFKFMNAMDEIRLAKDRFNKMEIIAGESDPKDAQLISPTITEINRLHKMKRK